MALKFLHVSKHFCDIVTTKLEKKIEGRVNWIVRGEQCHMIYSNEFLPELVKLFHGYVECLNPPIAKNHLKHDTRAEHLKWWSQKCVNACWWKTAISKINRCKECVLRGHTPWEERYCWWQRQHATADFQVLGSVVCWLGKMTLEPIDHASSTQQECQLYWREHSFQ